MALSNKFFGVLVVLFSCLSLSVAETTPSGADKKTEDSVPKESPAQKKKDLSAEELVIKKSMEELFQLSRKVNTKDEMVAARKKIGEAMDWTKIAQDCLGPTLWKKQGASEKELFQKRLREVVEKTAYTRLDKFWTNTTYEFEVIQAKGSEGYVKSKFLVGEDTFSLEYFLRKSGQGWKVYDISYEDIRYSKNINEQLLAFLKEGNFKTLLEKLKKRSEELDK